MAWILTSKTIIYHSTEYRELATLHIIIIIPIL
jgi:hypothetical protein